LLAEQKIDRLEAREAEIARQQRSAELEKARERLEDAQQSADEAVGGAPIAVTPYDNFEPGGLSVGYRLDLYA